MVGVSAITLRSGESQRGAPSVREESQVSGSLISRLFGAAAREPSGDEQQAAARRQDVRMETRSAERSRRRSGGHLRPS